MGGYGVFFGGHRDTVERIPVNEDQTNNRGELQTNNRGELRAALRSLQGHQKGHRSLICPVNGVLGWAQRWRRHKWCNTAGPVKHVDLWTQSLNSWTIQGTKSNGSTSPRTLVSKGTAGLTTLRMWGDADCCSCLAVFQSAPIQWKRKTPRCKRRSRCGGGRKRTSRNHAPQNQHRVRVWVWTRRRPRNQLHRQNHSHPPPPPSPLWDIEVCTLVPITKRHRTSSPAVTPQWSVVVPRVPGSKNCTPATGGPSTTPFRIGTARTTFRMPHPLSPMTEGGGDSERGRDTLVDGKRGQ